MCTSIHLRTKDAHHLLARTMDFSVPLGTQPIFIPRDYHWNSSIDKTPHSCDLGFVGTGRDLGGTYFVADGINEAGLSISELYLPGEVQYQKGAVAGKLNFAPHELILYILGNFKTIDELNPILDTINLVESPMPVFDFVTPLHWIISDQSGRCVVIEPLTETLSITENPIGVLSNSPNLEWHIQNLRNYLHIRPMQYDPITIGEFTATPFSQGTGSQGLPGGYTPPERFVRAAFLKQYTEEADDELSGVETVLKILGSVRVPKNLVVNAENFSDYSQYVCMMCNESLSYYYEDYASNVLSKVVLTEELLSEKEVKLFPATRTLSITTY